MNFHFRHKNHDLNLADYIVIFFNWKKRCNVCGEKVKLEGRSVKVTEPNDYESEGYKVSTYFKNIYQVRYKCMECNLRVKPRNLLWL